MKYLWIALCLPVVFLPSSNCNAQRLVHSQRLVHAEPESGRFVKTDHGFMVPYKDRILGTDVEFEMIPVPGDGFFKRQPFWIGKYEVTMAEYFEFMKQYDFAREQRIRAKKQPDLNLFAADVVSAPSALYDSALAFGYVQRGDEPVHPRFPATAMTRAAARQYTKWLSLLGEYQYRLPLETEWEVACRAGTKTKWSFGDDPANAGAFCVYENDSRDLPMKVGSKKPNPWGIHDMHGNASEWVLQAKYLRNANKIAIVDTTKWKSSERNRDENETFNQMILKGGDWSKSIERCTASSRERGNREFWDDDPGFPLSVTWTAGEASCRIGFRIVSSLNELPAEEMEAYWSPDTEILVADLRDLANEAMIVPFKVQQPQLQPRGDEVRRPQN